MKENAKDNREMSHFSDRYVLTMENGEKELFEFFTTACGVKNCRNIFEIYFLSNFYYYIFSVLYILLHFSRLCVQFDVLITINDVSYNRRQGRITSPKNRLVIFHAQEFRDNLEERKCLKRQEEIERN